MWLSIGDVWCSPPVNVTDDVRYGDVWWSAPPYVILISVTSNDTHDGKQKLCQIKLYVSNSFCVQAVSPFGKLLLLNLPE